MTGEERRRRLLDYLHERPEASVDELAQFLAVSKMTVHRDLDRLQELRVLRKTRGGATLLPSILSRRITPFGSSKSSTQAGAGEEPLAGASRSRYGADRR